MALIDKNTVEEEIIDIDIAPIKRKKFRINGDGSRIIELNISDLGIIGRLEDGYKKLQNCVMKVAEVDTESKATDIKAALRDIDAEMCAVIDYIFDASVSTVCADGGTMYDPYNGVLRYEHILETLLSLYEENIKNESLAIQKRMQKHTSKYTKASSTKPSSRKTSTKKS